MPAQAAISFVVREGASGPASLGTRRRPGQHRGARPFLTSMLPWPRRPRHPPSKRNHAGANPVGSRFLSTHKVCGPPVKRCELGAMPRGGAIFANGARPAGRGSCLENSRTRNGVQGSTPWRSAILIRPHGARAARLILNQQNSAQYRVRVPFLHRLIAQK